jgi:hypothetical protein
MRKHGRRDRCFIQSGLEFHRSVLYTEWSRVSQVGAEYTVVYSFIGRCCIQSGLEFHRLVLNTEWSIVS